MVFPRLCFCQKQPERRTSLLFKRYHYGKANLYLALKKGLGKCFLGSCSAFISFNPFTAISCYLPVSYNLMSTYFSRKPPSVLPAGKQLCWLRHAYGRGFILDMRREEYLQDFPMIPKDLRHPCLQTSSLRVQRAASLNPAQRLCNTVDGHHQDRLKQIIKNK